jgi:hypothetical protein
MNPKNFFTQLNRSHTHKATISYAVALIRLIALTLAVVLATASSYSESWQPPSEAHAVLQSGVPVTSAAPGTT